MSVCILSQDGEGGLPRKMQASPDALLQALAPYRDEIVIAVACIFPWYGLADLCAQAGRPFVLGHARSMKAIHGDKAKHDTIDSQKIAVLLRGGLRPQASVYPAELRATRALLRRRMPRMRTRAALRAPIQHTNSPSNLPEIGQKLASKGNRDSVAARFLDPAVPKRGAVDLALIDHYDRLRSAGELTIVQTAKQHNAQALSRLQAVPGIGKMLRVVWR